MTAKPLRILIGGGARSGKSAFALERACRLGSRRVFVATAEALDGEMQERIDRHRRERDASFTTLEAPIDLPATIANAPTHAESAADVLVVDCLTLWISNLLVRGDGESRIHAEIDALAQTLEAPPCHVVLVSNEVGFGIVPENRLARDFRDLVGRAHQRIAPICDELYLGAIGVIVRLRPAPLEVVATNALPRTPGPRA